MSGRSLRPPAILGDCRFESRFLSNRWRLLQGDSVVAEMRRIPSRHISVVQLPDGSEQVLRPEGWGTVIAFEQGRERGRIVRASWWGRAWEVTTPEFACTLSCDPLPRSWSLRFGSERFGRLSGTLFSYNRTRVHTDLMVPITALALAWHVLARSWELAAAPGQLLPSARAHREPANRA
jgi:hypothetical protein